MNRKRPQLLFYTAPPVSDGISPLSGNRVQAGFPSPAENYMDEQLDLNKYCVKNPPATFFVRVEGDSMVEAGINKGDLIVVDRSLATKNNDIVIAIVEGEFTLKRLVESKGRFYLQPANPDYRPIEITEDMECEIWGKVTKVIHEL